jgi:hypothetical protein
MVADSEDEPAISADVSSFGEIPSKAKAGLSPTGGPTMALEGPGTPGQLMSFVLAPLFSGSGLPIALALILADKSLWLALAGLLVPQVFAVVWWTLLKDARPRG